MSKRVVCGAGVLLVLACSAAPDPSTANAGDEGSAGSAALAGTASSLGGAAAGSGGAGGVTSSGAPGQSGGMSGGATGVEQAGSAGAIGVGGAQSGGGVGGAGGSAGGSSSPAVPSAGCGKGGRPQGGKVTVNGDHIYDFPEKYDGKTPLPMLLGLHANANPYTQIEGLTNNTKLASEFVRVFPKSAGAGWVVGTDTPRIKKVFDEVLANYCVDTSRVFLTGHSSGAQMAVQMLCAGDDRFRAVAPVAASKYCSKVSPIPVMYIQGTMDAQRGGSNGKDVVDFFVSSNSCQNTSVPDSSVQTCKSTFDQKDVTPGCVSYQGCSEPTVWCSHNDNGYNSGDGHMHGWPCFASSAMASFFLGLP